jgi:hypothetical protein
MGRPIGRPIHRIPPADRASGQDLGRMAPSSDQKEASLRQELGKKFGRPLDPSDRPHTL